MKGSLWTIISSVSFQGGSKTLGLDSGVSPG